MGSRSGLDGSSGLGRGSREVCVTRSPGCFLSPKWVLPHRIPEHEFYTRDFFVVDVS